MKKTVPLTAHPQLAMKEDNVVIHPNDGFDLGLMNREYPVHLVIRESIQSASSSSDGIEGKILLENECPQGTVSISQRAWRRIGEPEKLLLVYKHPNLYILPPG